MKSIWKDETMEKLASKFGFLDTWMQANDTVYLTWVSLEHIFILRDVYCSLGFRLSLQSCIWSVPPRDHLHWIQPSVFKRLSVQQTPLIFKVFKSPVICNFPFCLSPLNITL